LYDRKGTVTPLALPRGSYQSPRVSPDGKWLALQTSDGKQDAISIYELSGANAIRRLTYGGNDRLPVWSANSTHVAFQSDREGDRAIFWQPVSGGLPERLTRPEPGTVHRPESWSGTYDVLLFSITKDAQTTLWTLSMRDRKIARFGDVTSVGVPTNAVFRPDGRWVAYQAGDGATEAMTWVQPFPATGDKFEIVRGGRPMWSVDGTELFYVPAPSQFMAVSVHTQPTFGFTTPVKVPRRFALAPPVSPRPYDVLPDGRFVAVDVAGQAGELGSPDIHVVLNWFEELKKKAR
jgi:Tol biopolymer transport system component